MVKPIMRDVFFLAEPSQPASRDDMAVAQDLLDTLHHHQEHCVGMAANMIGVQKSIIVVSMGLQAVVMFNPVIVRQAQPYEAEEGCLSLTGTRKTMRYQEIEVEYMDRAWRKQRQRYHGWIAQIIQHEIDHLSGIII